MATIDRDDLTAAAFEDAEMANLRSWMKLSGGQKVDFFEEMVELAYHSGALRPERLALRDLELGSQLSSAESQDCARSPPASPTAPAGPHP